MGWIHLNPEYYITEAALEELPIFLLALCFLFLGFPYVAYLFIQS